MNFRKYKADLHIHSNFSDGKFSPITLLEKAKKAEINVISITDHDSVNGTRVVLKNHKKYGVDVIPGIEFSCDMNGKEVHLLGYFIDIENKILEEYIMNFRKIRVDVIRNMILKLNKLGCKLDADNFISSIPNDISIGRPHLAAAMVKEGFVKNYIDAFVLHIGDGKPTYEKKKNPVVEEIINLISNSGGISFVAHPGKNISAESLNKIVKFGINGIEIIHPSHSPEDVRLFKEFAEKNNLLVCGGTDFHGIMQNDLKNWGKYFVGKEEVDKMKNSLPVQKIK